jgi:hypothetical protein
MYPLFYASPPTARYAPMEQVMTLAQEKHEQRLQLANRKRAEAMFRKFGDS